MKNKIFNLCLCLFCLITFLVSCSTTSKIGKSVDYENINAIEESDYLISNISYPNFDLYNEFNNKIKNYIESDLTLLKTYAEKSWNEVKSLNQSANYQPFEYYVKSEVFTSGNIISVLINTYSFTGGAHGNTNIKTLNYDTNTNEYLNITEASGYSYNELSEITRKELYKKLIEDNQDELTQESIEILNEMREEKTAPNAGNFQKFILDNNKLIIYFEPYEVAPYYYGIQSIEIPNKI